MKAHLKNGTGRLVVEVEADNVKALFRQIAEVQEIMDADSECGSCSSPRIKFRVRKVEKFEYYELYCGDCGAALTYGQLQDGTGLFPHRKDKEGNLLPNCGWTKYIPAPKK